MVQQRQQGQGTQQQRRQRWLLPLSNSGRRRTAMLSIVVLLLVTASVLTSSSSYIIPTLEDYDKSMTRKITFNRSPSSIDDGSSNQSPQAERQQQQNNVVVQTLHSGRDGNNSNNITIPSSSTTMTQDDLNDILSNLNYNDTTKPAICAMYKCFFHTGTLNGKNDETNIGYLITIPKVNIGGPMSLNKLQKAYELGQLLDQRYPPPSLSMSSSSSLHQSSYHSLRSPPYQINHLTQEQATLLNSNLVRFNKVNFECLHLKGSQGIDNGEVMEKRNLELKTRFKQGMAIFLQQVQIMPQPHFIVGCQNSDIALQTSTNCLVNFLRDKQQSWRQQFLSNFESNMKYIQRDLLLSTMSNNSTAATPTTPNSVNNPFQCLVFDFQIMLDGNSDTAPGNVHHIDLDRCFQKLAIQHFKQHSSHKINTEIATCFDSVYKLIGNVKEKTT